MCSKFKLKWVIRRMFCPKCEFERSKINVNDECIVNLNALDIKSNDTIMKLNGATYTKKATQTIAMRYFLIKMHLYSDIIVPPFHIVGIIMKTKAMIGYIATWHTLKGEAYVRKGPFKGWNNVQCRSFEPRKLGTFCKNLSITWTAI